jgi:RimJ/RimL family protein N-acetyltransferase
MNDTTADVTLRAVEPADLEVFFKQEHDAEAVRRSRFTPRDHERFMTHWTDRILGDPTVLVRTISVDGETAGNLVAWWEADRRFLGYWLGRRFWGRGIATAALAQFLRQEDTRPLYADPAAENTASVRLLERHGFHHAGTLRHDDREHTLLTLDERSPALD